MKLGTLQVPVKAEFHAAKIFVNIHGTAGTSCPKTFTFNYFLSLKGTENI